MSNNQYTTNNEEAVEPVTVTKNTLLEDTRYLLVGFAGIILNFLVLGLISSCLKAFGFNSSNTPIGLSISLTSFSFLITGIILLFIVNTKVKDNFKVFVGKSKATIALHWVGVRRIILAIVIAPFIYFSSIGLSVIFSNFFESGSGNNTTNNLTSGNHSNLFLAIAFVVLLTPIIEEFFFRGVLLGSLLKFSDSLFWKIASITFTSVLFGFMHVQGPLDSVSNILAFTAPFTLGLIAAIFRVKTNSIYPAIGIHVAYNTLVTILMFSF